ncbi:MAG: response regulator [Candidatus Acidiferrales bacterium]
MRDNENFRFWNGRRNEPFERPTAPPGAGTAKDAPAPSGENTADRRMRRRAVISAPVRVRSAKTDKAIDEISTTVDVSRNGFLFVTASGNFSLGMAVAVTFPYSKSPAVAQAERPGRVARVSELAGGRFAVAVALEPAAIDMRVDASAAAGLERANDRAYSNAAPLQAAPDERPLVILVDSDSGVRELLRTFLDEEGYEVMALRSARQAHALLDQMLPALVIAEIEGHDLPGYDLCARIKSTERLRGVPVVLTTQLAYPSDYSNAHSLGAVVCIAKPLSVERIGHVVRLLVPTRAARRQTATPNSDDRDGRSGVNFRQGD